MRHAHGSGVGSDDDVASWPRSIITSRWNGARSMGIGADVLDLLALLRKGGYLPTPSRVIEIGAQQLANSALEAPSSVVALGAAFGAKEKFVLEDPKPTTIAHGDVEALSPEAPAARALYEWLGFRYSAVDIDGSEGALELDLNYDRVADADRGKFQLVTNFGTTEHVVNQLNAFEIIHDFTAQAGVMIHYLPAQGFFDHGLVNYNPKFFWLLARSNNYKVIFQNLSLSTARYEIPDHIIEMTARFVPDIGSRARDYRASDSAILIVLQKVNDAAFVPPIDVPTGASTNNPVLKERYRTVFDPGPLGQVARLGLSLSGRNSLVRRVLGRMYRWLQRWI
jgi:hypothetical protein